VNKKYIKEMQMELQTRFDRPMVFDYWLIIWLVFFCPAENLTSNVTIAGEGLQILTYAYLLRLSAVRVLLHSNTYYDTAFPFLRSYPKDLWFSHLNAEHLTMEQSLHIF
jgi:hypothetical protein